MKKRNKIKVMTISMLLATSLIHNPIEASSKDANTNQQITYTVKKGDTLYKIGKSHGVPYKTIKQLSKISSNTIYPGQKLIIKNNTSVSSTNVNTPSTTANENVKHTSNRDNLIAYSKKFIGTPYVWGGSTAKGFDCSGFIYHVLNGQGLVHQRLSTSGYWNSVKKLKVPNAGDLIFFQGTYRKGVSHMGILIGGGKFIHAGSRGVEVADVNSSYWRNHFLGYGTFF